MSWLLSPLNWMVVAALLMLVARHFRRAGRWLLGAGAFLALAALTAMTPLVANVLTAALERATPIPPDCLSDPPSTVIVLSGGVDRWPADASDFAVLNLASRRRLEQAVDWWRQVPGRQIVVTGGEVHHGQVEHSRLMASYAHALGVPAEAMRLELAAENTLENARNTAALDPPVPRHIALTTSAMHMPRALVAFSASGFEVCPLPADYRTIRTGAPGFLLPRSGALVKTEAALHEWAGLIYYRWLAWREDRINDAK